MLPEDFLFYFYQYIGGVLREFASLDHHLSDQYYKGCLMKFNSILLTEYKRVIFMDSDGLANANLDHLFFLPFPENIFMAAPQGYWFGKDGVTIGKQILPICLARRIQKPNP